MEILQILLSFFASEYGNGALKPVVDLLKENSFDIKRTLKSVNPQTLISIFKEFMIELNKKNPPAQTGGDFNALSPIANVADKQIVYSLNKYLCSINT